MTIENRGALLAGSIGSPPAPIVTFTARDPNPTPGIWKGLTIRKGGGANLGNVLIEYGGGPTGANLTVQNDFTDVVVSEFRHSAGCGVRLPSAPRPGIRSTTPCRAWSRTRRASSRTTRAATSAVRERTASALASPRQ